MKQKVQFFFISLAFLLLGFNNATGQSPGGVAPAAWYRAGAGVYSDLGSTPATDNASVQQWNSQIGSFPLIQSNSGLRPVFSNTTTLANFNPTVTFDGSNDLMEFAAPTGINVIDRADGTILAAGYMDRQKRSGFAGFHSSMDYPGLHVYSNYKVLFFTAGGPGYQGLSTGIMQPNTYFTAGSAWANTQGGTVNYLGATVSLNGNRDSYSGNEMNNVQATNNAARDFRIGRDSNWGAFSGQLNEVLVFEDRLNAAQLDRVETYLAIKYGTTFADGTRDYVNSGGTAVWTEANNTGFHHNIAGIARDDAGALYQKQSWSTNAGNQVLIGVGDLANTNASNAATLDNSQYLIWGDNGLAKSPTVATSAFTGISHHFAAIWKVENTGSVGTVRVAWPKALTNLTLIQSSDATIGAGDTPTPMAAETTINGVVYNYADVTLTNGSYFTIGAKVPAPGGVTNGLTQWYRADESLVSESGDGSNVTTWTDFARGTVSAQISTAPVPLYKEGATDYFNFNPGVQFTAIQQMLGNIETQTLESTEFDIFTFTKEGMIGTRFFNIGRNNSTFGGNNWDSPGLYASGNIASRNSNGGGLVIANPGNVGFSADIPSIMYHSFTNTNMVKGLNGAPVGAARTYSARSQAIGGHIFGSNRGTNPPRGDDWGFVGHMGEVIIYGAGNLDPIERQRVDSYLAIKYGITLPGGLDYLDSNGDIVWDANANSTYHNNVAGITHDEASALNQKQSISVNDGQQVLIGTIGLDNTNAANATGLSDGQYLIWGDNGLPKVPSVAISGVSGVNYRFASVWKVQNTGGTGNVRVAWPTGLTNLTLVQSADPAFGTVSSSSGMTANVTTINGAAYNYAEVTLADGSYFTFATQLNGPGGVSLDLRVWLRSDAGFTPDTWTDFSGNNNDYTQATATRQPFTSPNLYNFNPAVDFGTTGGDARFMTVPSGQPYTANGTNSTLFTATLNRTSGTWREIIGFGGSGTSANNPVFTTNGSNTVLYPYTTSPGYDPVQLNRLYLDDVSFTVGTPGIKYGKNGLENTANVTFTAGNSLHANGSILGAQANGGEPRDGLIGEVIAYERDLDLAEKVRVRSYVAIKYGVTLAHNYVAANGTTTFWDRDINDGYNDNIAGIARDDQGSLYQKQSNSINPGLQVVISTTGLAGTNATNTIGLSDQQFLVWGDNGLAKSPSVPFATLADGLPYQRFAAVWKVQNTAGVGTVRVAWPKGLTNLKLIVSDDENFTTGDDVRDMDGSQVVNGVEYAYTDVTLANARYFTFAAFLQGPGGVTEGIVMWHKANDGVVDPGAKNYWQDVSGNARDVEQGDASMMPGFAPGQPHTVGTRDYFFNYNPFYVFDGNNDAFLRYDDSYFSASTRPGSVYSVAMQNSGNTSGSTIFSFDNYPSLLKVNNTYRAYNAGAGPFVGSGYLTPANANLGAHIGSVYWKSSTDSPNEFSVSLNGHISSNTNTVPVNQNGVFLVGGRIESNTTYQRMDGGIPEIVGYEADHQNATGDEELRINSYLAIKYGITLKTDVGDASDYLSSASATVWDASTNDGYNNNIAGLANDFLSALHQKQSTSANLDRDQVIIGLGEIAETNVANPNALADGQFLLWGDNGNTQTLAQASEPFSYAGTTTSRRMTRIWKTQNTGVSQEVLIRFPVASIGDVDLGAGDCQRLVLIVADNADFNNAVVRPLALTDDELSYDATYTFPGAARYFTYAKITPYSPGAVYLPDVPETTNEYGSCGAGEWAYYHQSGASENNLLAASGYTGTELDVINAVIVPEGASYEGDTRQTNLMPRITTVAVDEAATQPSSTGKIRVYYSLDEMDATAVDGEDPTGSGWYVYKGDADAVGSDVYADGLLDPAIATKVTPDVSGVEDGVPYVEFHNIDELNISFIYISTTESDPLPVSLISFTAALEQDNVRLNWSTASEHNNSGFEIERSQDARNWKALDFVGRKTETGNSNSKLDYSYTDSAPLNGTNYYRLKQIDADGSFEYSQVRSVRFLSDGIKAFIHPNPSIDGTVTLNVSNAEVAQAKVFTLAGVRVLNVAQPKGNVLDVKTLPAGQYIVEIVTSNNETITRRLIIN